MHAHCSSDAGARPELAERWANLIAHREVVVRTVARLAGDLADAEDCVHEAMARLVRRTDLDPQRVRALLIRAAVHIAIDERRRSNRERTAVERLAADADREVVPDGTLIARAEVAEVTAAIQALPPRERDVLMLRLTKGHTVEEVAALLGVKRKTVEGAHSRGRQRLRFRLKRQV